MKKSAVLALCLCMCILLSSCGRPVYEKYTLTPNEYLNNDDPSGAPSQLTAEDIQSMNGGNAEIVYSDEGYITFLNGRFSDMKVENYEQAVEVLQPVAKLIGLGKGSEFFAAFASRDNDGYTYYTFQQRYGSLTVQYAALRVVIDPEGYTAGLSCSFAPNIGIADEVTEIGEDAAMDIVREKFASYDLTVYEEQTHKVALPLNGVMYNVYAIYTNNPDADARDFDMLYYEHFVTVDGQYVQCYPVHSFGSDNMDVTRAEDYFKGLKTETVSYTVQLYDGTWETVKVTVSFNINNKKYYLADPERKIAVGYYDPMSSYGATEFVTSDNGMDWRDYDLITYNRYCRAYDYYNGLGLSSVDGTGIPILVCTQMAEDNACYFGIHSGWACFAASDKNVYSEAMDVVGHEFTHGITCNSMTTNCYFGHTGAINEAMSDIMGNIMEMSYGMTDDTQWLVGEHGGGAIRSMSDPWQFQQPVKLGDRFYADPGDEGYDNGGVHVNSSLLAMMAYRLYTEGMGLDDQSSLWLTTIELMTPLSSYPEVYAAMRMSIDINGFDASYKDILHEAFAEAGLI